MKRLIFLLMLIPNLAVADKVVDGFYGGIQTLYIAADIDDVGRDNAFGAGFYFGAGKVFKDKVYLSIEGEFYSSGNEIKEPSLDLERKHSIGMHIKMAAPFVNRAMPYWKLGIVGTEISIDESNDSGNSDDAEESDDWEFGYSVALGAEIPFTRPWAARVEFGFVGYDEDTVLEDAREIHGKLGLTYFF